MAVGCHLDGNKGRKKEKKYHRFTGKNVFKKKKMFLKKCLRRKVAVAFYQYGLIFTDTFELQAVQNVKSSDIQ